ncbi:putative Small nuclear ribonucleoprotein F [Blattamonas nauphoetae]|uniref:Sm protein F n=1 Tax=Blattamonas nauphoetae TaxID=2049346 RepID=A0ABQ9XBX9_9EUKA|nr:putative Small nuclear ribonucleoprotein F [Blattamonas nauphoetae]
MQKPLNPPEFLSSLIGQQVNVRLKWGNSLRGILVSTDPFMNLQLSGTEEFIDKESAGLIGEVLVRCNNVLYIEGLPEDESE